MEAPKCSCGEGQMLLRQSIEAPYLGRWYYTCPQGNQCEGFQKWWDSHHGFEAALPSTNSKKEVLYSPTICPGCSSIFTNDDTKDTASCGRTPSKPTPDNDLDNKQMSTQTLASTNGYEYDRVIGLIPVLSSVFLVAAFLGVILGMILGKLI